MTVDVTVQCSLGRFSIALEESASIKEAKTKIRHEIANLSHVNLKAFRINVKGNYLSDESKTLAEVGVATGDVLHFVKKSTCAKAALDTEKKAEDE